jgi:hypothetical protein
MVWPNALARHFHAQVIQARERAQVRAIKDSIGHVEVFRMDGVGTPIIERPRPLPGHDTPNPTNNTYTLNYEEPYIDSFWGDFPRITREHFYHVGARESNRRGITEALVFSSDLDPREFVPSSSG